jgi:hypothetical protein
MKVFWTETAINHLEAIHSCMYIEIFYETKLKFYKSQILRSQL